MGRDDGPGEMDRLFREFDRNRDGDISEREFLRAMDKLRLDLTDSEARRLMRRFDRNNDGRISYREFIRFAEGRGGVSSPSKRDRDGDRFSMDDDEDELAFLRAMDKLRLDLTDSEARRLIRRFDRNNDGRISYREFIRFAEGRGGRSDDRSRRSPDSAADDEDELASKVRKILRRRDEDLGRIFREFDRNRD